MKDPAITWANILNYKHLHMFSHDLSSFYQEAKKLGYPYFCWGDRIYDTINDGIDTGILAEDVDQPISVGIGAISYEYKDQDTTKFARKLSSPFDIDQILLNFDQNVVKLVTDNYMVDDYEKIVEFFDGQSPDAIGELNEGISIIYTEDIRPDLLTNYQLLADIDESTLTEEEE